MPCHLFSLADSAWIRTGAEGAAVAKIFGGPMRSRKAGERPSLDNSSEAMSLRSSRYSNAVPRLEKVGCFDLLPNFVLRYVSQAKFLEHLKRTLAGFCHVPLRGFVYPLRLFAAKANLQRAIPVFSRLLLLHHHTRTRFNHRDRDDIAFGAVKLRHAKLSSNEPRHKIFRSKVYLLKLDFDINSCGDVELAQCVDGLLSRFQDVEQTLVSPNFILVSRLFVNVRRAINCEAFDPRRQWNGAATSPAGSPDRLDDFSNGLVQHAMIVSLQSNSNFFVHVSLSVLPSSFAMIPSATFAGTGS